MLTNEIVSILVLNCKKNLCFIPMLNIREFTFMLFTKRVTNCALDVKFISTKD